MVNYYTVLGISSSASEKEIKKAYRRLVMKYHPDKNQTEQAKKRFIDIQKAYEALTMPEAETANTQPTYYSHYKAQPTKSSQTYENLKTYGGVFAFLCATTLIGLALYSWGTSYKISQAWTAYQAKKYAIAQTHLLHILESDASNSHANKLMTKILVEEKRASSLLFALSAVEENETDSAILTYLSLSYLISRDRNSAEASLYQALHFNEQYDSANMLLGYILYAKGQTEEAQSFIEKVKEKEKYVGLMEYLY